MANEYISLDDAISVTMQLIYEGVIDPNMVKEAMERKKFFSDKLTLQDKLYYSGIVLGTINSHDMPFLRTSAEKLVAKEAMVDYIEKLEAQAKREGEKE